MKGRTKIRKNDLVQVISGRESQADRRGRVLTVNHQSGRVKVEGINMVRKAQKARRSNEKGKFVDLEAELDLSNVMLVCSHCSGPVRSAYRFDESGQKVRCCRKCKGVL